MFCLASFSAQIGGDVILTNGFSNFFLLFWYIIKYVDVDSYLQFQAEFKSRFIVQNVILRESS
jgi:uncharacterized protein YdeI (YjbR/CyaY-like superfamily)